MDIATDLIKLADGTQICAPTDIKLMSNFVLREQRDWFEDEIHFVRSFIQPDMQVLDIGANYGLYSMAIAGRLGDEGKLWCFEPTPNTARALRESITANSYESKVEVIEAGLSAEAGTASFYASSNAELNSLHSTDANAEKITIELQTLDECLQRYEWTDIDFIKLDAEGEEVNILKGAEQTLTKLDPLVMFELKHGNQINQGLLNAFTALGFEIYRLIPGLNVLAPFNPQQGIDGYLLNLFACKSTAAEKLKAKGQLVTNKAPLATTTDHPALNGVPSEDEGYRTGLNAYIASTDNKLPMQQRYQHLLYAFGRLVEALNKGESRFERLCSYTRIAFELGQREIGIKICNYLLQRFLVKQHPITQEEAFVPMSEEFEAANAGERNQEWAKAMIIDQFIRKHAFSCYFTGAKILPMFNELEKTGFMRPDMKLRQDTLLELVAAHQS